MSKKLWLIPLVIAILGIIIFIGAGLPITLDLVKKKIETGLAETIRQPVKLGSLKGNLLYTVKLEDLNLGALGNIKKLECSYNIFKFLNRQIYIDRLIIGGLDINVNQVTNLINKLGTEEKTKKTGPEFALHINHLEISDTKFSGIFNNQKFTFGLTTEGKIEQDILFLKHLAIKTTNSQIRLNGKIPLNTGIIDINYNLDLLFDEFNLNGLKGSINGQGTVKGNPQTPKITNRSQFKLLYQEQQYEGQVSLNWTTPWLDSLKVNAEVRGINKLPEEILRWNLNLNTTDGKISGKFNSNYGNINLLGTLSGETEDPQLTGKIEGRFSYQGLNPQLDCRLNYANNRFSISYLRLKDKGIKVLLNCSIDSKANNKIWANIDIQCDEIGIFKPLFKDLPEVTGSFALKTEVNGILKNPEVHSRLLVQNLQIGSEGIEDAEFDILFKNRILTVPEGRINSPRGRIDIRAKYHTDRQDIAGHIRSPGIVLKSPEIFGTDTVPVQGKISLDINFEGNILNPLIDGKFLFSGFQYDTIKFDEHRFEFAVKDSILNFVFGNKKKSLFINGWAHLLEPYPFKVKMKLEHLDLTPYFNGDTAHLCGELNIQGSINHSEAITGQLQIDTVNFLLGKTYIRQVGTIIIGLREQALNFDSFILSIQGQKMQVEGRVPLMPEAPGLNVRLVCNKIELSDLVKVLPQSPEIEGRLSFGLDITGRTVSPEIDGTLSLEDIKYRAPNILVDSVAGVIQFKGDRITTDYIKGSINKGNFLINGFAVLKELKVDTMAIRLSLDEIDFDVKDFGSLIFTSRINSFAHNDTFSIDGDIIIERARYCEPFKLQKIIDLLTTANRPPTKEIELLKKIYCNIGVSSRDGIKILNNVADVELGLNLQIKGYLSHLNVSGTINTLQKGYVKYLGQQFEIVDATIRFDNPYEIDPVLSLDASHRITTRDGDYEISMNFEGTTKKWHLRLNSRPPLPEPDIVSLLLVGKRRPGWDISGAFKNVELEKAAQDYAIGMVRGTIERNVEKTLGLEDFTIKGDLIEPRLLHIGFERKIGKRLKLIYSSGIEVWELQTIGLNYDLNKNISIFTRHDQEHMNSSIDLDFHFKLR